MSAAPNDILFSCGPSPATPLPEKNAGEPATPRGPLNLFDILQASGFDKDAAADIVRNERLKRFDRSVLGNELIVEKNPPSMVDKRPVIRIDPGKVRSFASRIAKTAV